MIRPTDIPRQPLPVVGHVSPASILVNKTGFKLGKLACLRRNNESSNQFLENRLISVCRRLNGDRNPSKFAINMPLILYGRVGQRELPLWNEG